MPARSSRQSTARGAAQPEGEEGAYTIPNLNYTEALSWRAGRAIPVAELFARLQRLSTELKAVEQGTIEVKDIAKLAQDLVNPNLLGHKDKGIRAWTVIGIVEILNICAPNAPYRPGQLKDIFTVIASTILPALADPSNAYNAQHQYILDQLVETQSIVLITDIPDPEQLLGQLFAVCFDVVSGSGKNASGMELAQSVVFQIGVLLNTVVDEANLPQDVVDVILSQFLRVDPRTAPQQAPSKKKETRDKSQSTLILKDYPPAYNLAKGVCTTCAEKMSASISQYFGSIITNASAALAGDDGKAKHFRRAASHDSASDQDDQEALNDLKKAHRLVRELWRACPDVLANVIPQLELELAADSTALRQLAVETLGDLVSGIGLAGLPDMPALDSACFPLPTIDDLQPLVFSDNPLLKPTSPKPFIHVHLTTYQAFLGRRIDKAMQVRKSWVTAASRILLTAAGGIGLNKDEQSVLLSSYARLLKDVDEKVRLAAIQELEAFPYSAIVDVLGADGGLSEPDSVLSTLAERVTDRKITVREKAMLLLGSMWGVASSDIANNNDQILAILGPVPTRLFSAMYVKDPHISIMMPKILYECLLPLNWPPYKGKGQTGGACNPDALRARRLLTLIRDLDERAKPVFFRMQKRQAEMSKAIYTFLNACEDYNGGVLDDPAEEARLEDILKRFIDSLSRQFADPSKATNDLWKFAKAHDRRNYQLIRFAVGAEHDYKTMTKAIRELNKRLQEAGATLSAILDTVTPILYQCALISYNRSHIPAIMESARSEDVRFAETAQEVLREISEKVPEVMKTHIQVLCSELQASSPSERQSELATAVDSLKACAAFARRFPDETPKERKFVAALQNFVLYSSAPKAAKHAANIILTTSDKKELRAKEILSKALKRYNSDASNKLAQLSAIAQVCLQSPEAASAEQDQILKIAVTDILKHNDSPRAEEYDEAAWTEDVDQETSAKLLALKILVNRCRAGHDDQATFHTLADSVVNVLIQLIKGKGEFTPERNTPSAQRNHLRLAAARSLLKLCCHKRSVEELVKPETLQEIAWMFLNRPHGVRKGLSLALRKYLATNKLNIRWVTPLFLLAFEPDLELRNSTAAWLRSRTTIYRRQQQQSRTVGDQKGHVQNVMETAFARLLSLLAHHPDYPTEGDPNYNGDLLDFAKNIIFYLQSCSTEDNLSLIFHIAQRTKQAADAIAGTEEIDQHLYVLSDLAQATIRNYADQLPVSMRGVNLLQTWPGKAQLPSSLFKAIDGHEKARHIAAKNYLPEEVAGELENLVRKTIRQGKHSSSAKSRFQPSERKRKSSFSVAADDDDADVPKSAKKAKTTRTSTLPIRKTPKKRKGEAPMSAEQPSRKSARTSKVAKVNYEESDEDEDEGDENVVSYKPALMDKYKAKSKKVRISTPDVEVEEEDTEGITAPTEKKGPVEAEDDHDEVGEEDGEDAAVADTEMTNGHDHGADENEAEDETTTPQNKRTRARKIASTSKSSAKTKTKPKTSSKPAIKETKTKAKAKSPALTAPSSSPLAKEGTRRSLRRAKP